MEFKFKPNLSRIYGIEGLMEDDITYELKKGAKFVIYQYCVSAIIVSFKLNSVVYFIKNGESAVVKGLPFTIFSAVIGWWCIPWGLIYTVKVIKNNFKGGINVTDKIMNYSAAGTAEYQDI